MDSVENQYYNYNISWWEEISAPSEDEKDIIKYLESYDLEGLDVLHVGVGNNFVARAFPGAKLTGLTISILEYQKAVSLKMPNYFPILIDKHDPALDSMLGEYDLIIDNNIGSYSRDFDSACRFLQVALKHLKPEGSLITHTAGLAYRNPFDLSRAMNSLNTKKIINYGTRGVVFIN
jgi:hypothetical protein